MDDYHPHYPSTDKDHYERVMRCAAIGLRLERMGCRHWLLCQDWAGFLGMKEIRELKQ